MLEACKDLQTNAEFSTPRSGVSSATVVVNTHNGETFAYLKPHQTVPPSAKTASLATSENCICSDADPRSDDTLLVTYDCYHQALYGNCNATFMKDYLEELVQNDGVYLPALRGGGEGGNDRP